MTVKPALIGKAGEMLVAAELMRRGVEVAVPVVDIGVDLLAYRLDGAHGVPTRLVPIQVKAYSGTGYHFQRRWFERAPGVVLVSVWHTATTPEFYVLESIARVEEVLGDHALTDSWRVRGGYTVTAVREHDPNWTRMQPHRGQWERIIDQLQEGRCTFCGHDGPRTTCALL